LVLVLLMASPLFAQRAHPMSTGNPDADKLFDAAAHLSFRAQEKLEKLGVLVGRGHGAPGKASGHFGICGWNSSSY
jgi:hypothetical protein